MRRWGWPCVGAYAGAGFAATGTGTVVADGISGWSTVINGMANSTAVFALQCRYGDHQCPVTLGGIEQLNGTLNGAANLIR